MNRLMRFLAVALLVFSGATFVLAGAGATWRGVELGLLGLRAEARVVGADTPCPHAPGTCTEFLFTDGLGATRGAVGQWPLALGTREPGSVVTVRYRGQDDAELASALWLGTLLGLLVACAGVAALWAAWAWRRGNRGT